MFDPRDEGPSAEDLDRFGGDTIRCASCNEELYHDAAFCPSCGEVTDQGSESKPKRWVVVTGVIALLAFVLIYVL